MSLQRLLNPIKRKLYTMVGKALLTAVNNSGEVGYYPAGDRKNPQRLNMNWLGLLTDVERAQPYGFETYPIPKTAVNRLLAPDGSRSNAYVFMVQDDDYRPTDGSEGDVIAYGKNDKTVGEKHRVHFKADGSIEVWTGASNKIIIAKDGDIDIVAPNVNITGNLNVQGNVGIIGDTTQTGDYNLTGSATISVEATIATIPYTAHLHIDSIGGTGSGPQTAAAVPPIPFATHTHDYTWTDPAGAGTTDPPA